MAWTIIEDGVRFFIKTPLFSPRTSIMNTFFEQPYLPTEITDYILQIKNEIEDAEIQEARLLLEDLQGELNCEIEIELDEAYSALYTTGTLPPYNSVERELKLIECFINQQLPPLCHHH